MVPVDKKDKTSYNTEDLFTARGNYAWEGKNHNNYDQVWRSSDPLNVVTDSWLCMKEN